MAAPSGLPISKVRRDLKSTYTGFSGVWWSGFPRLYGIVRGYLDIDSLLRISSQTAGDKVYTYITDGLTRFRPVDNGVYDREIPMEYGGKQALRDCPQI